MTDWHRQAGRQTGRQTDRLAGRLLGYPCSFLGEKKNTPSSASVWALGVGGGGRQTRGDIQLPQSRAEPFPDNHLISLGPAACHRPSPSLSYSSPSPTHQLYFIASFPVGQPLSADLLRLASSLVYARLYQKIARRPLLHSGGVKTLWPPE